MGYKENLINNIKSLLNTQNLGVLATQGKVYPYCTLISYCPISDLKTILFATMRESRKYRNLIESSSVSLLIDSRMNQINDFKDAEALTVLGIANEIDGHDYENNLQTFLKRHPYLEEFVTSPNCALIKITVKKYILVNNFQNVLEYNIL